MAFSDVRAGSKAGRRFRLRCKAMLRFVVLEHRTAEGVHWDFMLEEAGHLRTWSLPAEPRPGFQLPARELAPHRLVYLEYEGPISGDRGFVVRWDMGQYTVCTQSSPHKIRVHLKGRKLCGTVELEKLAGAEDQWHFRWPEALDSTAGKGHPCCPAGEEGG